MLDTSNEHFLITKTSKYAVFVLAISFCVHSKLTGRTKEEPSSATIPEYYQHTMSSYTHQEPYCEADCPDSESLLKWQTRPEQASSVSSR